MSFSVKIIVDGREMVVVKASGNVNYDNFDYRKDSSMRCFELFWSLYGNSEKFKKIMNEGIKEFGGDGTIRFFDKEEWDRISELVFNLHNIHSFNDFFINGLNIGSCLFTSEILSYSYDDVDYVEGVLPILAGTYNCKEGRHKWLERDGKIYDTSLMLIIDKYKWGEKLGYKAIHTTKWYELYYNERYCEEKKRAMGR